MNMTPQQIDAMSLWQFAAMSSGFAQFHGAEEQLAYPTDDEYDDMVRRHGLG